MSWERRQRDPCEEMIDTVDLYFRRKNFFMSLPCRRLGITIFYRFWFWYRVFTGWTTNWTGCKESWNAAVVQKDEKKRYPEETGSGTCGFQRGFGGTGSHPEVPADKRTQAAGILWRSHRFEADGARSMGWLMRAGRAVTRSRSIMPKVNGRTAGYWMLSEKNQRAARIVFRQHADRRTACGRCGCCLIP